jgi:hypothetical protein
LTALIFGGSAFPASASASLIPLLSISLDDGEPGVTVNPTSGLVTTEASDEAYFTVVLDTKPKGNVEIDLASSDTSEGTVSIGLIKFTASDWDQPQTVTVTGEDDSLDDGDKSYTILITIESSSDDDYEVLDPDDASVTNQDDDGASLLLSPNAGLMTAEGGGQDAFSVALGTQPSGNVVIDLTSSDLTEGTVSPASLTFTTATWATPKIVTVTGVDDFTADLDMAYNLTLHVNDVQTADPNYDALADVVVPALNSDDDTPGYTVSPTTGETSEGETSVTIDILLKSRPKQPVTLDFIVDDPGEGKLSTDQIVIQPEAWVVNTPSKLVVTGVDDTDPEPDQTYHVVITPTSTDGDYDEMEPGKKEMLITLVNKDAPSIIWVLPVPTEGSYFIDSLVPVLLRVANAGTEPIERVTFYYWDPENQVYVPIGEDFTAPYQAYLVNIDDLPLLEYTQVFARAYSADPPGPELPTFSNQKRILIYRRDELFRNFMPFVQ